MDFRRDINGLRALAVITVLFYHFKIPFFSGGFVGVDIFFVISGFLMTSIVITRFQSNSFSFYFFFKARADRIVPPLLFLCVFLIVFGWFYLSAIEYRSLGKHIFSSLSFISNYVYLSESGYFDSSSLQKWLLHTWSLSLEWQFYIIWPFFLFFGINCFGLLRLKVLIIYLTIVLLFLSFFFSYLYPESGYYNLFTRSWEMMFGALAYLFPISLSLVKKHLLYVLGLILIFLSFVLLDENILWPSPLTILPVLGTFFVIVANFNRGVLDRALFQYIGTRSYSIYLWHWPIAVLLSRFYFDYIVFLGLFLSFIFGSISWYFIENKNSVIKSFFDFPKFLIYCVTLLFLSFSIYFYDGFNSRFDGLVGGEKSPKRSCAVDVGDFQNPSDACEYFSPSISWAILGDSHSIELSYAFAKILQSDSQGLKQLSYQGCFPNFSILPYDSCTAWYAESLDFLITNSHIDNVIISHRLSNVLGLNYVGSSVESYNDFARNFSTLQYVLNTLSSHKKNVYLVSPFPELDEDVGFSISYNLFLGNDIYNVKGITLEQYQMQNKIFFDFFKKNILLDNVYLIDVTSAFCDDVNCFSVKNGKILYFDSDHPSVTGANIVLSNYFE